MSACASKPLRASENLRVGSQNLFAHHGQFYMCQKCGVLCYFMKGMEKPSGGLGACFGSSAGHWFTGSPTYALFGQAPGPISTTPPPQFGYQNNFRHCAACNGVFYGAYWGPNTTSYCPAGRTSSNLTTLPPERFTISSYKPARPVLPTIRVTPIRTCHFSQ